MEGLGDGKNGWILQGNEGIYGDVCINSRGEEWEFSPSEHRSPASSLVCAMYGFNSVLGCAAALVVAVLFVRLAYMRLLPKPIPGVPHNPITGIWGDIPKITRVTKEKTFGDYIADEAREHGSLFQVSTSRSRACRSSPPVAVLKTALLSTARIKILIGRHPIVVVSDRMEAERILLRGKNTDQSKRTNEMCVLFVCGLSLSLCLSDICADYVYMRHGYFFATQRACRFATVIPTGQIALPASEFASPRIGIGRC